MLCISPKKIHDYLSFRDGDAFEAKAEQLAVDVTQMVFSLANGNLDKRQVTFIYDASLYPSFSKDKYYRLSLTKPFIDFSASIVVKYHGEVGDSGTIMDSSEYLINQDTKDILLLNKQEIVSVQYTYGFELPLTTALEDNLYVDVPYELTTLLLSLVRLFNKRTSCDKKEEKGINDEINVLKFQLESLFPNSMNKIRPL